MKDKFLGRVSAVDLQKEIVETFGFQVDLGKIFAHVENKFMPDFRYRINTEFIGSEAVLILVRMNFHTHAITGEFFGQTETALKIIDQVCKYTNISLEDMQKANLIWSVERNWIPTILIFTNGDAPEAVACSCAWSLDPDVTFSQD